MTEVVAPIHGRRLDGRFTLLEKLGSGGQGEVWRAHDETRGIDIALKVPASAAAPNESVLAAFEREHAIAARLDHSSVLKVFPPHRSGEVVVLPMELATGGDLRRLRGAGYLDIIPVLLDIAQALEHAHERGVIHRDLKPGNVLFDARGRVKLADFGAAGTTSTTAADARLQGLSPFTASPEQLRGEAPTESDDIYGLGALAYELLSGYPPYYPHFDIRRAQEEPVPPLVPTRQIPPLLSALVTRMLAKNRRERPRSMREVIDELDAALNDTLAFDFESIVDPSHGAPSAAVLVGPASGSRPGASVAANPEPKQTLPPSNPTPVSNKAELASAGRDEEDEDDDERDDDESESEDEVGPDLGLIPELLVANALVATPSPKGHRSAAPQSQAAAAPSSDSGAPARPQTRAADHKVGQNQSVKMQEAAAATTAEAAGSQSRKSPASTAQNDTTLSPSQPTSSATRGGASASRPSKEQVLQNETMHLPPETASPTRAVGAAWRASNAQTVHNDTMHLSADTPSTTRGAGAGAWRTSSAEPAQNDTMQLPPEPGPTLRGVGAAWRVSNAETVHNDTMHLPPDQGPAPRGAAVASRSSYAQAANEQVIRPQAAPTRAPARPAAAAVGPTSSAQQVETPLPAAAYAASGTAPAQSRPPAAANRAAASNQAGASSRMASNGAAGAPIHAAALNPAAGASSQPAASNMAAAASNPAAAMNPATDSDEYLATAPSQIHSPRQARAQRQAPAPFLQHASFATAGLAADGGPSFSEERPLWENLKLDSVPRVARLEPIRPRRWPIVLLGILAGVAVAVFYWLPRYTTQSLPFDFSAISRATKNLASSVPSSSDAAAAAATPGADTSPDATLQAAREKFDQHLAALETRGAGVWGGPEFGLAKTRAAESVGAHDAGNTRMAEQRLADASQLLDQVESKAPQALDAQLAAGQKALAAGQEELANQAFDLAKRIDPNDKRIAEGQRHTRNLNGVLPLLADGQNAESAQNYSRAAQDYSQALSIDPGNDKARAGLARANAAFGDDNYAKAVGSGFAALGAGRLDDAREAFEKARALRPNGTEASDGLRRVNSALSAKGFSSLRQRAAGLEAQERWDEAVQAYDSALQADPSLAFAQEGKDRAAARAELNASLQALIDRPERLSSPSIRAQAKALLDTANQQSPSGPVLRSQIARLGLLMPDYDGAVTSGSARTSPAQMAPAQTALQQTAPPQTDIMDRPVRLSLVSDNATAVAIPSIGQFGTFAKRDIQLKPGRYTVIGTRDGFRDVRRDITIAPGQESQTVSVSCSDPI